MIDFNSALIYFDCESQKCIAHRARGKTPGCSSCDYAGEYTVYLGTLFSNLAIAGSMQAMFDAGREYHAAASDDEPWCPNIDGRAPGWREK